MVKEVKVLVTMPKHRTFFTFFNDERVNELEKIAEVVWNESETDQFTKAQLCELIKDIDVIMTGWGTIPLDEEIMQHAHQLKLVAHTGGSVNSYVTDAVYEKGVRVVSGNNVFAESVAESVIAYALASLRDIPKYATELKQGIWPSGFYNRGLLNKKVGLVGYGMIAKYTVEMLKPFHPELYLYARRIEESELEKHNMTRASLEQIFSECDVISLHLASTDQTFHMIDESLLRLMKDGALLINTARGAIVDEEALIRVMREKPIFAALDVFEVEPLPANHDLMSLENATLMPHMGGPTVDRRLIVTKQIIEQITRYYNDEPLICEISQTYARQMTV